MAVVPAATFVWIILLIFAVTSIPQALISRPSRQDERQQRTERPRRRHQPARPQSHPQKAWPNSAIPSRNASEPEEVQVNCYECATAGTGAPAVAICFSCNAGLCLTHVRETANLSHPGGTSVAVGCIHDTWSGHTPLTAIRTATT